MIISDEDGKISAETAMWLGNGKKYRKMAQ
jgi:hypothetical protein